MRHSAHMVLRSIGGLTAGVVALAIGPFASAGPLDPALVDGRSKWVVHMDMEAARASSVGAYLDATPEPDATAMLAQVQAQFGIDPSKDVLGITVFGGEPTERDGVAVVEMTAAADALSASLPAAGFPDFAPVVFADSTGLTEGSAWRWRMDGRTWFVGRVNAGDRRLVLLAPSEARLSDSMRRVLDRTGSLASSAVSAPERGSILFVSARGLGEASEFRPNAAVFKLAEDIFVDVRETGSGEGGGTLNATVRVETRSGEAAVQMQQMLQGVLAFSTLAAADDAELAKQMRAWTSSLQMTTEGKTFTLRMAQRSEDLIRMIRVLRAKEPKPPGEAASAEPAPGGSGPPGK